MQKIAALAALLPLVAGHGYITSPTPRKPGSAYEAACGQQPFNQQSSDINGNVQGILQVVGDDFDASACNLWLCKGFLLEDSPDNVQSYSAGESVDFKINIAAPHTGYANVSVVKTSSNSIIGTPLIEFENYASNAGMSANNSAFSVTIPDDLGSDCSTAGDCVLQWFWNAPDIDQTYEGCVDFTVGGSSSGGSSGSTSTAAAVVSSAAATSAAAVETSAAATTALAAVTQTGVVVSTPAAGTPSAPASTPSDVAGDDDEDCDDEGDDEDTTGDDEGDDEDCDADEGDDDTTDDGDDEDCYDDEETTAAAVTQAAVTSTEVEIGVKATSVSAAAAASSSAAGSLSGSNNYGQSNGKGASAVTSYVTVTAAVKTQYVTVTADAPACT